MVKTRVQLQTGAGTGAEGYNGMLDCFKKIIKNEGYAVYHPSATPLTLLSHRGAAFHDSTAAFPPRS